ncbi:hypothetical protein HDU93_005989, partial [Gonapodya sp. JEL0774]
MGSGGEGPAGADSAYSSAETTSIYDSEHGDDIDNYDNAGMGGSGSSFDPRSRQMYSNSFQSGGQY